MLHVAKIKLYKGIILEYIILEYWVDIDYIVLEYNNGGGRIDNIDIQTECHLTTE